MPAGQVVVQRDLGPLFPKARNLPVSQVSQTLFLEQTAHPSIQGTQIPLKDLKDLAGHSGRHWELAPVGPL